MKALLQYCVRRPKGVLAVYAGLALVGVFAWFNLPQELMPDLRFPQLTVVTVFPNASPEEVENLVAKPIEEQLGSVQNVRRVDSVSKEQVSIVNVQFKWDTDMDAASLWVQERLGLIQDLLPLEAKKPEVTRFNPFDKPVLLLGVFGELPLADLDRLVETRIRPALEKVSGVSAVQASGGLEREIQVDLDAEKLAAHQTAVAEVAEALRARNVARSAGSAEEGLFEYPITVTAAFPDVAAMSEAVVRAERPGRGEAARLLRLGTLGQVKDGFRERSSRARYDGKDNISLALYKRSEAYPVQVAREVRAALSALSRQLPDGARVTIVSDQSIPIQEGISDVMGNVLLGGFLGYGVLWLFLRSHRRSLLVGATIPLALLLTMAVFWRLGLTINLLTLGGLALGVGMLVDSAVVILENMSRHRDMGKPIEKALIDGGSEVGGAVVFAVLTTVASFAPIPFAAVGVAQKVFTPICAAVIITQAASLIVGFTFVPALGALILEANPSKAVPAVSPKPRSLRAIPVLAPWLLRAETLAARLSARLAAGFDRALEFGLRHPGRLLAWAGALTLASTLGLLLLPRETMPEVDQPQFLMTLTLPAGTRLEVTDDVLRKVEGVLESAPEVAHRNAVAGSAGAAGSLGPNQGRIVVDLWDRIPASKGRGSRRRRSAREVARDLTQQLKQLDLEGARVDWEIQGADVFSQVFGRSGADLAVEIRGSETEALQSAADGIRAALLGIPGVARAEDNRSIPSLQIRYEMDEARLARDALSVADVAESVLGAVHGNVPTAFREAGKEIPIRVRLRAEDRGSPAALARLVIPSPLAGGGAHPLSEYGALRLSPGPSEIRRLDQQRAVTVSVFLSGRSVAGVLPEVRRALQPWTRRRDIAVDLGGEAREVGASFRSLLAGFAAAVALVYIVLVAQFNVLWVPLLAMAAVPLSINGVTPALFLTGNSLNLMSGQGLMILAGIVVNNSLLLLEFIQQGREAGLSPEEAVREASRLRRRPIFMTVLGNVAGLVPLALGLGRGAQLQSPMAVTVIFGLLVSTALTLVVLPSLYLAVRARVEG